jgi:hypothetical protein
MMRVTAFRDAQRPEGVPPFTLASREDPSRVRSDPLDPFHPPDPHPRER